eukprot:495714_1
MAKQQSQILASKSILLVLFTLAMLSTLHFNQHQVQTHRMVAVAPLKLNILGSINTTSPDTEWRWTPSRNATNKAIAWQKFYNGTGQLIVIHARKAGGTTTRRWMGMLIKQIRSYYKNTLNQTWNTTFKAHEFWSYYHSNNHNRISTIFSDNPHAIYVMAFRDPIQRILSQYDFEWRWGCQKCTVSSQMSQELSSRTFMKYYKEPKYEGKAMQHKLKNYKKHKVSNIELGELLARVDEYQSTDSKRVKYKIAFNAYLNNYYLWMFCCDSKHCNIEKDLVETNKVNECLDHAMQMILSFDIILVDEWMNDIRTQQYVNHLLLANVSAAAGAFVGMDTAFKRIKQRLLQTSRGKNVMIHKEILSQLRQLNRWDLKLYTLVKQVAFQQHNKI